MTTSREIHERYIYSHHSSIVKLVSPSGGSGSGFIIEQKGKKYIITNRHVCMMNKGGSLFAINTQSKKTLVSVLVASKAHDLCLMTAPQNMPSLDIAKSYSLFDNNFVLGHPLGLPLTFERGRLVSKDIIKLRVSCEERHDEKKELNGFIAMLTGLTEVCFRNFNSIRTNSVIYPGNSGSPSLNVWGNVNGVVFAGSSRAENVNYLVPLEYLQRFLKSIKFK